MCAPLVERRDDWLPNFRRSRLERSYAALGWQSYGIESASRVAGFALANTGCAGSVFELTVPHVFVVAAKLTDGRGALLDDQTLPPLLE